MSKQEELDKLAGEPGALQSISITAATTGYVLQTHHVLQKHVTTRVAPTYCFSSEDIPDMREKLEELMAELVGEEGT